MDPKDLQLGDLIFFYSTAECPEHVAMYTGHFDGKPYITHEVTGANPGLKTAIFQRPRILEQYMVFRPKNALLGKQASEQILSWSQYNVPYDYRRAKLMHQINQTIVQDAITNNKNHKAALLSYLEEQAEIKFYEIIKFTARRETCPTKPNINKEERGFTCVQALILAYQTTELAPYVKTLKEVQESFLKSLDPNDIEDKEVWISDKHCDTSTLQKYNPPESYIKYNQALHNQEEFAGFYIKDKLKTPSKEHFQPSLSAWRYDLEPSIEHFRENFRSCLHLPAKICYTEGLEAYLQSHPETWSNLGELNNKLLPSVTTFSEEEKNLHRQKMLIFNQLSYNNRNKARESIKVNRKSLSL